MKKKLFLFVGVMTALASCSTEDIVDINNDTNAISFNASVGYSADTRSIESATNNLKDFYVTATVKGQDKMLMTNTLFYKDPKEGKYVTKNPYHWSHELVLENIYAYGYCTEGSDVTKSLPENILESKLASNNDGGDIEVTMEQQTINNFRPAQKIEDQIDFIFTRLSNVTQPGLKASVTLVFNHMLSEIGVDAVCSSKSHRVKVARVKYGNIKCEAQFDMTYNDETGSPATWTFAKGDDRYEKITTYDEIVLPKPVPLNDQPYNISLAEGVENPIGYAILLPQEHSTFNSTNEYFSGDGPTTGTKKIRTRAPYLAVLCRIEILDEDGQPTGAIKFPFKDEYKAEWIEDEEYGWAYIPFNMGVGSNGEDYTKWVKGRRYKYHLDFSEGAGFNEDGNNIIMGEVRFDASVTTWEGIDVNYIGKPKE